MVNLVETKTVTTKTIKKIINKSDSNLVLISLVPDEGFVELVIGACYEDRSLSYFFKDSLKELIDSLTEVWEVMDE